jgi:hypothetical protein
MPQVRKNPKRRKRELPGRAVEADPGVQFAQIRPRSHEQIRREVRDGVFPAPGEGKVNETADVK